MRFRIDTASISYTADKFARQVADTYIINDWLGLGTASRERAVARVRDIAVDLYTGVLDDIRNGNYEGGYHFHSTGRVKVIYWVWDDEPDEIEFLLNVEAELPDDDGVWQNIDYWDEDDQ